MRSIFPAGSLSIVACVWLAMADGAQPAFWNLRIDPLQTPASADSSGPQLSVSSRGVLLSWVERSGATASLKFSELEEAGWSNARTVASGSDWFVNWADVPSVVRLRDGSLVAHWLQKSEAIENPYYGEAMLTCGIVRESLDPAGTP